MAVGCDAAMRDCLGSCVSLTASGLLCDAAIRQQERCQWSCVLCRDLATLNGGCVELAWAVGEAMVSLAWLRSAPSLCRWLCIGGGLSVAGCFWVPISLFAVVSAFLSSDQADRDTLD
ncbi:hypothetical protein TcBrA4_0121690 [Trypanosoma cruzi]|nr:hypothetical protein TcBrA4_0121690 [Trypanosoma cruzi]